MRKIRDKLEPPKAQRQIKKTRTKLSNAVAKAVLGFSSPAGKMVRH